MPSSLTNLETALRAIGRGIVLTGDPFTASGLVPVGLTDGEIRVEVNENYDDLTAEQTGPAIHERSLRGMNPRIVVPIILGDKGMLAELSPTGTAGGGHLSAQPVTETSLVIFPESAFLATGSVAYAGGPPKVWAPLTAPDFSFWGWRGHWERPGPMYRIADGGKVVLECNFQLLWDAARPDGQKLFTQGDPALQGITTIAL